MINWISTSDTSRKPEIGGPVFIRGSWNGKIAIAEFSHGRAKGRESSAWSWLPTAVVLGYDGSWEFETVTHWAEIPEGLFNEPAA